MFTVKDKIYYENSQLEKLPVKNHRRKAGITLSSMQHFPPNANLRVSPFPILQVGFSMCPTMHTHVQSGCHTSHNSSQEQPLRMSSTPS